MREFGLPISRERYDEIVAAAMELYGQEGGKMREVRASDFAMEIIDDPIVVNENQFKTEVGRLRIATSTPAVRPPFEWLVEITSDIGEADYFKHYLVQEDTVVLAQRKTLIPIDDEEAHLILNDIETMIESLRNSR